MWRCKIIDANKQFLIYKNIYLDAIIKNELYNYFRDTEKDTTN